MQSSRFWHYPLAIGFALLAVGCGPQSDRPDHTQQAVPPGVSVEPPRTAPEAGGLVIPQEAQADSPVVSPSGEFDTGGATGQQQQPRRP